MKTRDFCYWMQGFVEIHGAAPTEAQWTIIKNHLNMVFVHDIDPSMPDPDGKLAAAHAGKPVDHVKPVRPQSGYNPDTLIRC